jgi:hypothetical protein
MRRFLIAIAAFALGLLPEAQAALMNTFVLKPGSPEKALYGGDLRVCNDVESTGAATVTVRPEGMVYLSPGRCFNEWGSMLTFKNEGSGVVILHYRSIAKNNGRVPGQHEFPGH